LFRAWAAGLTSGFLAVGGFAFAIMVWKLDQEREDKGKSDGMNVVVLLLLLLKNLVLLVL